MFRLNSLVQNFSYLSLVLIISTGLLLGLTIYSLESGKQVTNKENKPSGRETKNFLKEMLNEGQAIVWHLFHSAFAVKTAHHLMIFDYYYDEPAIQGKRSLSTGVVEPSEISDQDVIVFISHEHDDHFFPDCFNWKETVKNIHYVVSHEVSQKDERFANKKGLVTSIGPNQDIEIAGVNITTLESTDSGVAFLVKADGLVIYHSGDLGCWNWEKSKDAEIEFVNNNLRALKNEKIDIAFHVAEPFLSDAGWGGILAFAKAFKPTLLIPMHLRGNYKAYSQIKAELKKRKIEVPLWNINNRGDCILFKNSKMLLKFNEK